eukprot:TRINITY_DN9822_c0_g1_i2.p1 TRINITY_DN9822_c0_g1~~TRINITY_DN9822_c0_g1_i2.p1  ORF type:complete len:344 (-),score=74.21 TRINITY_DN9822_c0_g1_i2:71-1048(-)
MAKITPVLVINGFLGAGKTTVILNLIQQLPASVKSCWLKNEFGDVEVDSQLARERSIAVKEILNGCLCCTLTGRLGEALKDLVQDYAPDLVIIETSGSAYPAPLAWELKRLASEGLTISLDALICVIDAANFQGYEDKSYTAKLQAKYTDLILINKHELVDERQLDSVMDEVYELNPDTPKVKTNRGIVAPDLLLGLHTTLFQDDSKDSDHDHHEHHHTDHHVLEVQVVRLTLPAQYQCQRSALDTFLGSLSKESFYRVKGMIRLEDEGMHILNWAFGRFELTKLQLYQGESRLSFVGPDVADRHQRQIIQNFFAVEDSALIQIT